MPRRKLRIVKTTPNLGGVCERCGRQFESSLTDRSTAEVEVSAAFDVHTCLALDASQNALRVVHDATENK
jgi:hypothetical protein